MRGGHHDQEVILRRPTAVSLIVICATALAGSAVALGDTPFPVYGETPTTTTTTETTAPPAATPPVPVVPPAAAGTASREAELLARIDTLRRQLGRERAKHRRQLKAVRASARTHMRRTLGTAVNSEPVQHALSLASATFGVPQDRLRRVATCESTLNPHAGSGRYVGLFQFGSPLWNRTPYAAFSRTDPYASALAAAWAFSRGMRSHWPVCGYR